MAFYINRILERYVCQDCRNLLLSPPRPRRPTSRKHKHGQVRCESTGLASDNSRSLRVGIIGSGPAGFYAAARMIQKKQEVIVDMYEKLPAPFGLVRYGVAPDHPEVKNCQEKFEQVAASPRFNFIGNISVGDEVSLMDMKPHYDALLFAYGAAADRELGIPGEHLKGVVSARAFVGWYNGLPEYTSLQPDLGGGDTAYVIGNGNVALDVARILLSDIDVLRKTDIADYAIEALAKSRIKHVNVCGRRGPMQAAFTIKEVRELLTMDSLGFHPIKSNLLPQSDYISALPRLEQRKYRLPQLLAKGSTMSTNRSSKSWALESLVSPVEFIGRQGKLSGIKFVQNQYNDLDERFNPKARIHVTDKTYERSTHVAFRSIGYKSTPLHGLQSELGVPFNDRSGIIPNDMYGRILTQDSEDSPLTAKYVPGCYCTGWVKRGPTGVIASTMEDAFTSADAIMKDWEANVEFLNGTSVLDRRGPGDGWKGVVQELMQKSKTIPRRVSWNDWLAIDKAEQNRGKELDKPREKFDTTTGMLSVLD